MTDTTRLSDETIREWQDDLKGLPGWTRHRIVALANEALLRGQERDAALTDARMYALYLKSDKGIADELEARAERAEAQVAAPARLHYRYSHGELSLSDYNAQFDAIVPEPDDALKETP